MIVRLTDLSPHTCEAHTPLFAALEKINRSQYLFQVVVDPAGVVVGTLTDGDVRRALLRGVTTDAPTAEAMYTGSILGRLGADKANLARFGEIRSTVSFMPIIDAAGRLAEIWIAEGTRTIPAAALVMAGGFGRRLGPRTQTTPKPLLPVAGRPILDRILDRLEGAGIERIYVSVHHLAEQFEAHLARREGAPRIELIAETAPLGTAGAVALLPDDVPGPFLVMNGDILTEVDLQALATMHARNANDATIAVARHEFEIPYGVVRHGEDGAFLGIDEKPRVTNFVSAGIYLLSAPFRALIPSSQKMDMPELLNLGRSVGLRIGLFPIHEYWRDIGRPRDLAAAEDDHSTLTPAQRGMAERS